MSLHLFCFSNDILFFWWEEKIGEAKKKTSQSRAENQHIQTTYSAECRIEPGRAILVEAEFSREWANAAFSYSLHWCNERNLYGDVP